MATEMQWTSRGERAFGLDLAGAGANWLEVKARGAGAAPWHVDARLGGSHYKIGDAFPSMEEAQGSALLLAMRHLPALRDVLHAALDVVPGAWWWKISPQDDGSPDTRSIYSSHTSGSAEDAERNGRAAGAGWWLYVYGPGAVKAFGRLPPAERRT